MLKQNLLMAKRTRRSWKVNIRFLSSLVAVLVVLVTLLAIGCGNDMATSTVIWDEELKGNVIFFHPDGSGLNHWNAARLYFKGPDGTLNWDLLPNMAAYRGHMYDWPLGTSNGGATTHAFGYKVEGLGSFGKDGTRLIKSLSGFSGSIMREAANNGIPVGVVNDGHIAEPGTGAFLAEVDNRDDWQEITRQMIQGRPGMSDTTPWVIMGGGEADTRPQGTTLLHRNVNEERGQPVNSQTSLRRDNLDLEAWWNSQGRGDMSNDPERRDDWIVIKTRAEFERLRTALQADKRYTPRVLGIFAYQDTFNDRNEEDLIARNLVIAGRPVNYVGPAPKKESRLALWGDPDSTRPGHNPPTFTEMFEVAIEILDRAARHQADPAKRRFFLVAEQEAVDNFGNNNNSIGVLQAMRDTDEAIGVALNYLSKNPKTFIVTAADSDAGGMQVTTPYRSSVTNNPELINTTTLSNPSNPARGQPEIINIPDGLEGRGSSTGEGGSRMFLSEPDQFGQRMQFGIAWSGRPDYGGGILSRAAGLNARLLNDVAFSRRFDNIDIYRLMYLTLFDRMLDYPRTRAVAR